MKTICIFKFKFLSILLKQNQYSIIITILMPNHYQRELSLIEIKIIKLVIFYCYNNSQLKIVIVDIYNIQYQKVFYFILHITYYHNPHHYLFDKRFCYHYCLKNQIIQYLYSIKIFRNIVRQSILQLQYRSHLNINVLIQTLLLIFQIAISRQSEIISIIICVSEWVCQLILICLEYQPQLKYLHFLNLKKKIYIVQLQNTLFFFSQRWIFLQRSQLYIYQINIIYLIAGKQLNSIKSINLIEIILRINIQRFDNTASYSYSKYFITFLTRQYLINDIRNTNKVY
ncbi:unnamed protein product (macronuclear) [Paramecium tetraurelia]|uniref:Transmembrane protein n=1 Tax=Paramecium tetraurelia TaxID=5888 RepID=A0CI31_PARTE|nr:uncharacterized protein GSPATT00038552001 [Paramecium tetraurelia]CAK70448.1 unnamed protein product [Paramecium tetraurelia]|eukprot:XP_001437845.1 hypothetical protein (macronuclear) [Paramecium tetraurelia strain d4-2]